MRSGWRSALLDTSLGKVDVLLETPPIVVFCMQGGVFPALQELIVCDDLATSCLQATDAEGPSENPSTGHG